ncbi:MAG: ORF6N domain-containing protein [bacterium]|nr:ORF6N domain-containing protein [bacterium]
MEMLTEYKIIEDRIFTIRGQKVMVDYDLAELYGVKTKRLNEAVKRNSDRFPADFMFKLNDNELKKLVANCDRFKKLKYSSTTPNVFTEQGVAMLSSVLNSERAIAINIEIIRTFVKLRQYALTTDTKNQEIAELQKILMLHIENTDNKFAEHETTIKQIIDVLNNLIEKPKENNPIGFK